MQWGDLSFNDDKIGDYVGQGRSYGNLRFIRPITRMGTKKAKESVMDSRTMKLQSLSAIYALEHSAETLAEMVEEIESMKTYDSIFKHFKESLQVSGEYDAHNINFDCLKTTIDAFEAKYERFSDYGLSYIKYIAHACETIETDVIKAALRI